ncbi:MAG: CoA transferase [Chloroflexi bacterium]|nr:CoA transferase [Chloroflexota bacterium]
MELALSGVRVLDLTHYIAGPACTKLLADFGADVLKVERPDGDPCRRIGPFWHDEPHAEGSGLFLHLNTNKKSITLNLRSVAGQRIVKELARDADLVIEAFKPGTMECLGLGYESLKQINPSLVYQSVSSYGQSGPYRDYKGTDMVLYGIGGPMATNSQYGMYPLRMPGVSAQIHAGYVAAVAALTGYFSSAYQGIGQYIDTSVFDAHAGSVDRRLTLLLAYQYQGFPFPRSATRGSGFPQGIYPCKDGYVNVWGGLQFFPLSAKMMGMPELATDPHWCTREAQLNQERREEFETIFLPWIIEKTKAEFLEIARKSGILSGALFTIEDLANDRHFQEREFFAEATHPRAGSVAHVGPIVKMPESPATVRVTAPLLGEHNEEVYCGRLGFSQTEVAQMRRMGVV